MTSPRSARQGSIARAFRYLYRVPLLLVHLLVFLPLILLLMAPPFGRIGTPDQQHIKRRRVHHDQHRFGDLEGLEHGFLTSRAWPHFADAPPPPINPAGATRC